MNPSDRMKEWGCRRVGAAGQMPTHLAGVLLGCLLVGSVVAQPNIVLIMADDLGYGDLGCYGGTLSKTPRLDALAAGGLRATDFHSNGAVCSPTRAALMTGRYQQRSGIEGVVTAADHRHAGLALQEFTIAELMKSGGYATAMLGKWHLGYDVKFNPVHQGFDEFRGFVSGNIDLFTHVDQTGRFDWWVRDELVDEPGYMTKLVTDHGIDFIKQHKNQSFFLYLAHAAPHYPYQGPTDVGYRKIGNPKPILGIVKNKKRAYRDMVEFMDHEIGRIVDILQAEGLRENTLIVFVSDNGAVGKSEVGASNGLLRGSKGSLWEGGHRVPAIFHWPGTISASVTHETLMTMDLMPTFATLSGIAYDAKRLDGVELSQLLKSKKTLAPRMAFWGQRSEVVARDGKWKLIRSGEEVQLFDLAGDLSERKNIAAAHPEIVDRLSQAADTWLKTVRSGVEMRSQ